MRKFIDLMEALDNATAWWFDPSTDERHDVTDSEHFEHLDKLGVEFDPEDGPNSRIANAIRAGFVRVRYYGTSSILAIEASDKKSARRALVDALTTYTPLKLFIETGEDYHTLDQPAYMLYARNGKIMEAATLPLRSGAIRNAHGAYGAFIVVMSPSDFLELTTTDTKEMTSIRARQFPKPADQYNQEHEGMGLKAGRFDMPFLYVQFPSGKVVGHEGRHRAAMIEASGGKSFPVMIYPREQNRYTVTDYYHDDDWNDHEIETVYHSHKDANDHEFKLLHASLRDEPMINGWNYDKTKIKTFNGDKLRGAPARSLKPYQYAAWKVEDFPKQLLGQFNTWSKVTRFKVGLVKGYTHHREPE